MAVPDNSKSLARARPVSPDVKAGRIRHIASLMRTDQWHRSMAAVLASEWGLAVETVQHHAAEASRLVRDVFDREAARKEINKQLRIAAKEIAAAPPGPVRTKMRLEYLALVAKLSGASAPTRVALSRDSTLPFGFEPDNDEGSEP